MKSLQIRLLLLLFGAVMCARGYAQSLRLEKADGVFSLGDTVKVWATARDGSDSLVFRECFNSPTAKSLGDIGFIVAPEEFRPGFEEPLDFRSWWNSEISRMRALPLEAKLEEVPSNDPGVRTFSIEIPMHEGNPVRGYIGIPKDAKPGGHPIYMFAHGAGRITRIWTRASSEREVLTYAKRGAISIDINAHGMLNDAPPEYYERLDTTDLYKYQEQPLKDRESYYFRLMFLRMVRALDYMCSREEWDGKRVLLQGESQGGAQCIALAGLDPRVGAVVATVPAMTDLGGSLQGRQCAWPFQDRPQIPLSNLGRQILPYFDAALHLKYFKGLLYMEAGLIDVTCPAAGIVAGYNNTGAIRKEIHFFPYRGHTHWTCNSKEEWNKTVLMERTRFIEDYLK